MEIRKYKYYFKKPKSEIVKDIFSWLLISGAVVVAATSPYFIRNLIRARKKWGKYPKHKVATAFSRLRRQGFISVSAANKQIYISLTPEGVKKAGIYQINTLKIKRPQKWDHKWRLFSFDIPQTKKLIREALRGKLKQLGFRPFQKSIWIHPFDCRAETELLKDFFGLSDNEVQLIIAENVGNDHHWQKVFRL
jgi:phenylacetic acid degradation operon negative regulatory protein